MTWGKVSDRLHAHSKARRAREALALWVLALSWCCDELTDGEVPSDMPELLIPGGDALAERLVSVGLWERTADGFRFHDWAEYQPSAEDERERRGEPCAVSWCDLCATEEWRDHRESPVLEALNSPEIPDRST